MQFGCCCTDCVWFFKDNLCDGRYTQYSLLLCDLWLKEINFTVYFCDWGLRKVYPYYFTFTTFTKGRWVGEKILDVFAREFRAHPVEEYVSQ